MKRKVYLDKQSINITTATKQIKRALKENVSTRSALVEELKNDIAIYLGILDNDILLPKRIL